MGVSINEFGDVETRWVCPLCFKDRVHVTGERVGCVLADCPGVPLFVIPHPPGVLERFASKILGRPMPVEDEVED